MSQNNIKGILESHPIIPVVTIHEESEIEGIISSLKEKNIHCIEVTLRTSFALESIKIIKHKYGDSIVVGVGTVINTQQVDELQKIGIDFIVNPGFSVKLCQYIQSAGIPFIPGVSTPSEIVVALENGWDTLKFFPANLFGGIKAIKTYGNVFPAVKFCPTGGVNEDSKKEYLDLPNVISVGGSWMMK